MNKFEKQLEKWNKGTLRGAQAKLARLLKVSTATVALWATGKRRPSKGYAAQMADLFQTDVYSLMRLFDTTSTTYPEGLRPGRPLTLRDKENTDFTYNLSAKSKTFKESNSVSIPFLQTAPENYPQYNEDDVVEWWTLPRRCAKGAKYLVHAENHTALQDDLYLIKPVCALEDGKIMLLKTPEGVLLRPIRLEADRVVLLDPDGRTLYAFPQQSVRPLGVAVRKITDLP